MTNKTRVPAKTSRAQRLVFLVTHVCELPGGAEDLKLIGVYDSEESAKRAVDRAMSRPGFRDHTDGFFVQSYALGKDHWMEGFVRLSPT